MDNISTFKSKIKELNIELTDNQVKEFEDFMDHMILWNDRVRLTSITEENEVIDKHFVDSLSVLKTNLFKSDLKILDLGTGGGFPGIPLKLYDRTYDLTMIDSRLKKIEYLETVIEKFNLENTLALHGRAEDFGKDEEYREKFDIVVSRAVANTAVLSEYCLPFVKKGGYFIAMKGSEIEEELNEGKKAIKILGGKIQEVLEFKLPQTDFNRSIVIVKKIDDTPKKYPRSSGKPKKKPLKG